MRKYLLVILTFCYLGCEDSEDNSTNETNDVYISSDFIRCGHTYQMDVSLPSNDTIGIVYNIQWNNLVKKQPHPVSHGEELIRVDTIFIEYDQYGNQIFSDFTMLSNYPDSTGISDYPLDSTRNVYIDYWKLIQSSYYYKDGNNTVSNFNWDGLTRINADDPSSYMIHNEFGIFLSSAWAQNETMEDGKRIKSSIITDGSSSWTYEWDGYNFEMWINYSNNNHSDYFTGTIDEYANIIEQISYDCSVDPCIPVRKRINEFDCNMFESIPVE